MKIILCGPPHSGKTVFGNSLYLSLPQGYTSMIRACPDGESLYSSNNDQHMIRIIRRKGDFSEDFIQTVCERIKKEETPITLIDVGGKRTKENERIFELADSCIILSSDSAEKEEWKKFADKFRVKTIALLDSVLEGEDVLRTEEPHIDGVITNLERGTIKKGTKLFDCLRKTIMQKAITQGMEIRGAECLKDEDTINLRTVAEELRMIDENGNIKWDETRIKDIHDFINGALKGRDSVKFFESRAIWMSALTTELAKNNGIEDIQYYALRNDCYAPTMDLPQKELSPLMTLQYAGDKLEVYNVSSTNKLRVMKVESENEVFMYFFANKCMIQPEDVKDIVLPKIDESKKLYYSGRITSWLASSLTMSYDNPNKAILQAGTGFVTIASTIESEIGKIEKSPSEIDFENVMNEYNATFNRRPKQEHD